MLAQHLGDFFQWIDFGSHCLGAPIVQKPTCPIRGHVVPEQLELLLQQIPPHRLEIVLEQFRQLGFLRACQVLWALEQEPSSLGKHGLKTSLLQRPCFTCAHFVKCFAEVGHDVKAIENMHSMPCLLGNDFQVGLPHICADVLQLLAQVSSQPPEEPKQGSRPPILTNPQQTLAVVIDLVNQRQVLVPLFPGDFIDPNGSDIAKILIQPAPLNSHFHRPKNAFPGCVKSLCSFFPGKPLCP